MKKFLSLFCLIAIAWLCNVAYAETVTLWSEDFSSFSKDAVPSEGTYSYVCVNGKSDTKVYAETLAGGQSPELLVSQSGGSFSATIPLDGISGELILSFKANNAKFTVSVENGTLGTVSNSGKTYSYPITVSEGVENIKIKFSRTTSTNSRLDDILLTYENITELTAPEISGVENGGLYINSVDVIIDKPKLATSISYNIKKDGVTIRQSENANRFAEEMAEPGEYTVSASATDGTNTVAAEDVTFTIKSSKVTSIADFLALAPSFSDTEFEFDCTLIVTYISGKYLYVRDETGAPLLIYMDKTASDQFEYVPENGDFFDHGVKGKYKLYNTIQELINPTFPLCNAHKNAAEPKEITIGEAADNMSQYVKIKNVKFSSTTEIACGEETLAVTGSAPTDRTAQYTVVGVITYSSSTVKLNVVSYEEEKVLGTPEIEVTGETNATGFYLDKAMLKFVYPANATSMEYVVKKGETVFKQAENLTKDATIDITTCGDFSIEVTAYMGDEDFKIANKTIKIIPSAPTVSLAAGTYHEAQSLTITAPEGAKLDGLLGDTDIKNVSEFTTTLAAVNDDITTYELLVCSTKDGASSDAVSATFVINPNVFDAEVTGNIVIADQTEHNTTGSSVKNLTLIDNLGQTFTLTRIAGSATSYMGIYGDGLRMYKNNHYELTSDMPMTKIKFTASAYDLSSNSENWSSTETKTFVCEAGMNSFTFNSGTSSTSKIQSIEITYKGKFDYYKVNDGAALIGMEKGKFYQVNVNLEGVEANGGVLYACTSGSSAAPSVPGKTYFDKSYEDYDLTKFDQRDWVAIEGLTSAEYAGKEIKPKFIAAYDGEKLTQVTSVTEIEPQGDAASYTLNTFGVANVFYGNYENTESLDMGGYRPFFVKAKVNEVANFVGKVTKDTNEEGGSFRLVGSGKCGVFEGKGVLLEAADGVALSESGEEYKEFKGVLVAETNNTLAQYDVKIVALTEPGTPTGVAALKADGKATVYGTEGAVVVNGADGKVMIFDAMGRMVKSVNAEGAATVAMPAGYYIVRTAGTAAKVMVK